MSSHHCGLMVRSWKPRRSIPERWEDKFESLRASRMLTHNADYLEFLVSKVWRLDCHPLKIAEFGCGYGRRAAMLLPLLSIGTSYAGFDSAASLVSKGKEIFAGPRWPTSFIRGDLHHAPLRDGHFDVAICHLVLMYLPDRRVGNRGLASVDDLM